MNSLWALAIVATGAASAAAHGTRHHLCTANRVLFQNPAEVIAEPPAS